MGGKAKRKSERGAGEVMLLSCLFLIGPSRDGDHNNSFVEAEGGGRVSVRGCVHTCGGLCGGLCVCVCAD